MDRTFEIRLGFMRSMARTMVGISGDDGGGGGDPGAGTMHYGDTEDSGLIMQYGLTVADEMTYGTPS